MSLFVIAYLHLSSDGSKSMEVFGSVWKDYMEKIRKNWTAAVGPEDTVIIPGDVSWGLRIESALEDFRYLEALPGKKLLGKGNHDFWWTGCQKMSRFAEEHGIHSISFLYNNAYLFESCIAAGSRGWFMEENLPAAVAENMDYSRMINREKIRLRLSLDEAVRLRRLAGRELPILAFMHFPPVWNSFLCRDLVDVLHEYGVKTCYFGHIHGVYNQPGVTSFEGIDFVLCSADYLKFAPRPVAIF